MPPKNDLSVGLVQCALHWEDKDANLAMFDRYGNETKGKLDLLVLPEMFSTGFSMNPSRHFETMDGPTVRWMIQSANLLSCTIIGSIIISENGHYYNRLICAKKDGSLSCYDKRHLFSMAGEHRAYRAGNERLIIEEKGWSICPLICYDLRFPVWSRNDDSYDLLIYTANWPATRIEAWNALLCARAIENQSYVIGVNRIGSDGNDYEYPGSSRIYDAAGKNILDVAGKDGIFRKTLSAKKQEDIRGQLPFLKDRDSFSINL